MKSTKTKGNLMIPLKNKFQKLMTIAKIQHADFFLFGLWRNLHLDFIAYEEDNKSGPPMKRDVSLLKYVFL